MSDYSVAPIKGCWKNWERLAQRARVSFSPEQLILAREIFSNKENKWPASKTEVLRVRECFGPSHPSEESQSSLVRNCKPVHPVKLLTLLTGIGDEEKTAHREWTYRTVASSLCLVHPDGRIFTFLVDGGDGQVIDWKAEFIPERQMIGRSMYIFGYPGNEGMKLSSFFVPNAEGMYGRYATCFP